MAQGNNFLDKLAMSQGGGSINLSNRVNTGNLTPYARKRLAMEMQKRNVMSPVQRFGNPAAQQFAQADGQ